MSLDAITVLLTGFGMGGVLVAVFVRLTIKGMLAEMENRIIARINGDYVRTTICDRVHELVKSKMAELDSRFTELHDYAHKWSHYFRNKLQILVKGEGEL